MSQGTRADRLEQMQRHLYEVSVMRGDDPATIYRRVMAILSEFYDNSTAILSIRRGGDLDFKAVVGPISRLSKTWGNAMKDSYCQFAIAEIRPLIVQNAKLDDKYKDLRPARAGYCRYLGVPVFNPGGEPLGTLCLLDNKVNQPLDEIDSQFLSLLSMRVSSELAREDLRNVQEKLLETAKLSAVGTLSASIAHDIRNIVASLSIEIACGADQPAETLQTVKARLDRFNLLCHRLLSYSQPDVMARCEVDINDVLAHVMDLTGAQARLMKVSIEMKLGQPPPVSGDPGRLEHLFVNLVLNALKAMEEAGGRLTVTSQRWRGGVRVSISDTGGGIPKEIADRLFEPFASNNSQGFGLGLFSCKRIVSEHGGTIEARRRLTRGTVFSVWIPEQEATK